MAILYYIFHTLSKLLAPFVPFLSEEIYQNLQGLDIEKSTTSVHTQSWPVADKKFINSDLETQMEIARKICQAIHFQRQQSNMPIRQPLAKATINCPATLSNEIINIIQEETNIKNIKLIKQGSEVEAILDTKLTEELLAEGEYRTLLRSIQSLRRDRGLLLTDRIKITAPSWPKTFEDQLLKKTLANSITQGNILSIQVE
jgi:isoleucyl-tRNA synthetase